MSHQNEPVRVPWARPYFGPKETEWVLRTLNSQWLSQGENVKVLEDRLAGLTASPYVVAVNSGTAALDIALKLFAVGPGDEILVPAFAYIASVNCILYQGATPVFVDVDPQTYCLSVEAVKEKITSRTRGIIAIDYAGQAAPWAELRQLGREHNLFLIEDAAPALGGSYRGQALGTLGNVGITSFHTAKIFTTVEGGMLFMSDAKLAERACLIRSHGESPTEKYLHVELGHNYRMTDLHAAIGLAQFSRYEQVLQDRRQAAEYYSRHLQALPDVVPPAVLPGNQHAWFLYPILVQKRDEVRAWLTRAGIGTNISWPYPVYRQPYLQQFFKEPCPVSERLCQQVLCLPMYYGMTQAEQDLVIQALSQALEPIKEH
jgi:perosamine synthetase